MSTHNALYHHSKSAIEEEEELIKRAKRNPREFGVLYNKYYTQVFRFIWKRVGDENEAATIVSDVFVKAIQSLEKYQFKGVPFGAWLFQIARNEVNLYYRRTQKSRVVTADTHHFTDVMDEMEEGNSEEEISLLIEGLRELDEEELALLEMRYFEKRSFKEVSDILNIKVGTAKVKMHRVIQKLKKIVAK